jgi:hypothetical protein
MVGQGKKVMGKKGQRSGKRNPISLVLTVVVLFAGNFVSLRPASAQGSLTDQALIILDAADETAMQQSLERIEAEGGRIVHVFPTHVLISSLPQGHETALLGQAGIISIHRSPLDPSSVAAYGQTARQAVEIWNTIFASQQPQQAALSAQEVGEELVNDAFYPPDLIGEGQATLQGGIRAASAPGYYQTSEFVIGRVAVGIILPESDSSIDPSIEDWTSQEQQNVFSEIVAAMNWWAAREPRANLTFYYDDHFTSPLSTGYEPINRPHSDQGLWIGQVMGELGYSASSYFTRVRDHNNALRNQYQTDWAFTIFVVDSSSDGDNKFSDGYFAYAYLGGPFMVMTYGNNGYGPNNMDVVTAHEMGHIFHALDQYYSAHQACTYRSGYLYVENQNSQYGNCSSNEASIMRGQVWSYQSGAVDYYARGQVGWWDSDGDDILDPVDTVLQITLEPQAENPTSEGVVTYFGSVADIPYDSPMRPDVTINAIASVDYRLNGEEWQEATPGDGAFDSASESYTFTTEFLDPGVYVVDVRAINSAGGSQILAEGDILVILDPEDGALNSALYPYSPDPTTDDTPSYTGLATTDPANGATVARVEYRLDGGQWQGATASDGTFDETSEGFLFISEPLAPGHHTFEVRAIDSNGEEETSYSGDALSVVESQRTYIVALPIIIAN